MEKEYFNFEFKIEIQMAVLHNAARMLGYFYYEWGHSLYNGNWKVKHTHLYIQLISLTVSLDQVKVDFVSVQWENSVRHTWMI